MAFWDYGFNSINDFGRLNSIFLRFVYCNVLLDLRQNVKCVEYDTTPYMYWYFNISTDFKKFSLSKSSIKYKLIVHLLYFLKSQASIQVGSLAFIIAVL